jgi:hypothetical protein
LVRAVHYGRLAPVDPTVLTSASGFSPPPIDLDELFSLEEGPMRGDLRRQIARLEREFARLKAIVAPWELDRATPLRGPALLDAGSLEQVRDELLCALRALSARLDH